MLPAPTIASWALLCDRRLLHEICDSPQSATLNEPKHTEPPGAPAGVPAHRAQVTLYSLSCKSPHWTEQG